MRVITAPAALCIGTLSPDYCMQVDDYVSHEPTVRRSALHTQVAGSDDEEDGPRLLLGGRCNRLWSHQSYHLDLDSDLDFY